MLKIEALIKLAGLAKTIDLEDPKQFEQSEAKDLFDEAGVYNVQPYIASLKLIYSSLDQEPANEEQKVNDLLLENNIRTDNFNFKAYQELLNLTAFASVLEQAEQPPQDQLATARLNAAKLTVLFGSYKEPINYLYRFNRTHGNREQLIHDACLFSLPLNDNWDQDLWRKIVIREKPTCPEDYILRILPLVGKIETYVKENSKEIRNHLSESIEEQYREKFISDYKKKHQQETQEDYVKRQFKEKQIATVIKQRTKILLSHNTPIDIIQYFASNVSYSRAEANLKAAKLFFSFGIAEEIFDLYLSLTPKNSEHIPSVIIDGKDISKEYENFYLKKIDSTDPRAAVLGHFTSCCLSLDKQGKEPTIHGITQTGSYILCKKLSDTPTDDDLIVSAAFAWRGHGQELVLDSVETQIDVRKHNEQMVSDFFTYLAEKLVTEHDIPRVLVGAGGETPKNLGSMQAINPVQGYSGYGDAHVMQRIIADKELPFVKLYKAQNPESKLSAFADTAPTSQESIFKWCDLCLINKNIKYLDYILPHTKIKKDIYWRLSLTNQWMQYLQSLGSAVQFSYKKKSDTILSPDHFFYLKDFITEGVDVNLGCDGITALYHFAKRNEWEIVDYLLSKGADINVKNLLRYNNTVLHLAALKGDLELVKKLIAKNADINAKDSFGNPILHSAIKHGYFEIASYLIEIGAVVNTVNTNFSTPLHDAIDAENLDLVQQLMEAGAQVNISNLNINFPLRLAVSRKNLKIAKYLKANGADIQKRDEHTQESLLHTAASFDAAEIFVWLREEGLDVNAIDKNGETVLSRALQVGNIEIIQDALEHGAKMDIRKDKNPIIHMGVATSQIEIVKLLIKYGANIKDRDHLGHTILHWLAMSKSKQYDYIRQLIALGAEVNGKDHKGRTVLHESCACQDFETCHFFIEQGADMSATDESGKSILFTSLFNHKCYGPSEWSDDLIREVAQPEQLKQIFQFAQWLISQGMDVNAPDEEGKTLIQIAAERHFREIVYFLIENGANPNVKIGNEPNSFYIINSAVNFGGYEKDWTYLTTLIQLGVDFNVENQYGTPLVDEVISHYSYDNRPIAPIAALLEKGEIGKVLLALEKRERVKQWMWNELALFLENAHFDNSTLKQTIEVLQQHNAPDEILSLVKKQLIPTSLHDNSAAFFNQSQSCNTQPNDAPILT